MKGFALRTSISVRLLTPYAKEFVEALKVGIPALAREYEPASRTWVIYSPYEARGIGIARRYYEEIEIVQADRAVFEHERACAACNINDALDQMQRLMSAQTDRQNAEGHAQATAKQRRQRRT